MSLKSDLNGTFTLEELHRLTFPIAWSGTKDPDEAQAEEVELRALAQEASEEIHAAYNRADSDSDEFSVRIENGQIIEIVES